VDQWITQGFEMDLEQVNPDNKSHVDEQHNCNQLALYVAMYSPLQMAMTAIMIVFWMLSIYQRRLPLGDCGKYLETEPGGNM
jgi:hypothetical protein